MLSPQLRRKVHDLWSLFWSSGLSNPLVAIEQITFLLFIRQLESLDRERVKQGKLSIFGPQEEKREKITHRSQRGIEYRTKTIETVDYERCRWSYIRQNVSFPLLNDTVFPWLRSLEQRVGPAQNGNTTLGRISGRLSDAYFVLDPNKTETLKKAVSLIDELFRQLDTRSVNSDIMGDIFEYLLEEVKESGKNGQFRTPRHVIRFMVQLLKPQLGKRILDPACGSGGFLLNSLLQWKADHTDNEVLRLEWDGSPHDVRPVWPNGWKPDFNNSLFGYDNDRTMVRIAWMNLILHDLDSPEVHQLDALSKRLEDRESGTYDYILANPPFTGSVDEGDLSENRDRFPREGKGKNASAAITTKSELLFVWLMLDLLKIGGRAAVIVPDGVLFGATNAHRSLRRKLLFENTLEGIVSLPANMFQPYSGVKTSILIFQKAGVAVAKGEEPRTREVWFYEINDEAFSLDQRRKARYGQDNDLWDALEKFEAWTHYRQGDSARKDAAVAKDYHQPDYWEERWCSVDDDFLKIFPEKAGDKGHTYPLHELWPKDFPFDRSDPRGAQQYDDALLSRVRPVFQKAFISIAEQAVNKAQSGFNFSSSADNAASSLFSMAATGLPIAPDESSLRRKLVISEVEKSAKAFANTLTKKVREENVLDREFNQFGLNALKSILKQMTAYVREWAEEVPLFEKKPKKRRRPLDIEGLLPSLASLFKDIAKLDGYNVWRRGSELDTHPGKLTVSDDEEAIRQPTLLSWIVPVRRWAELESWGEDPATGQLIDKPTHKKGVVDPGYLNWLRDDLKVYDGEATVKKEYLDRLDPNCLEALDFNLSAGRHKPFLFEAGQHRPPSELIGELQAIHGEVQTRLETLLQLVGSKV